MLFIYKFLIFVLQPFFILHLIIKSRHNKEYRLNISERYSSYSPKCDIIIHCVSVGESICASGLIQSLSQYKLVLTTTTPTGYDILKKTYPNIYVRYLPYDISIITDRFIQNAKPKLLIIIETELWPNLVASAYKNDTKIILANARLSKRSMRRYHYIKNITYTMLSQIDYILAQSHKDARRFQTFKTNNIIEAKNLKIDNLFLTKHKNNNFIDIQNKFVFLAASTHDDENKNVLDAWHKNIKNNDLLIIAPRHLHQVAVIQKNCARLKIEYNLYSDLKSRQQKQSQVIIINEFGQLASLFAIANIAFIGGSLIKRGGHNPLEGAKYKNALLIGPHHFNFEYLIKDMLKHNGIKIVNNTSELAYNLNILRDDKIREQQGESAYTYLLLNQGSIKNHLKYIQKCLTT